MSIPRRLLIVGGVAGGASAAARARRLNEDCEIIVFERGPHVSLASCGLPYHVGNVIEDQCKLTVATPELFARRFNVDVRTGHEVTAIDRQAQQVEVKDLASGNVYREAYDALLLAPGAKPVRPPLPGIDLPGVFQLRTMQDAIEMRSRAGDGKRAVVVGGGYIGLEVTENLAYRGMDVTVVELAPHVMQPVDPEMATVVERHLEEHGVTLRLSDGLAAIERGDGDSLVVKTSSGADLPADLVVLSIGVRPETTLARQAELELGPLGGIRVDDRMRTSAANIWAVGDAVEVKHVPGGYPTLVALAGPATRQARIAAADIFGREASFRGAQGTGVVKVFDLVVAGTGCNETALARAGITDYERVYVHDDHHAGYYPGGRPLRLKLLYQRSDGKILGAQIVGEHGVARRIDVISMAIQKAGTVFDLEQAELCYAPQFGASKDLVNVAGMVAGNALRGDCSQAHWGDLDETDAFVVDVRTAAEHASDRAVEGPNIPVDEIRAQLHQFPKDREIWVYCEAGRRAYFAARTLQQHGLNVKNLPGGMKTFRSLPR